MKKIRVHNFSAGPATLPLEVLESIKNELINYKDIGSSIMEISHRDKTFIDVAEKAEESLRDLLLIPKNYDVLFLQGGATLQFSMIPLHSVRLRVPCSNRPVLYSQHLHNLW